MVKRVAAVVACAAVLIALALEVVAQTAHQNAPPAVTPPITITPAGTAPAGASPVDRGGIRFQRLDLNHDGKLSREEAARSTFLSKHFDEIDTNHDGFITPDEKRAAWKARMEARNKTISHAAGSGVPPASRVSASSTPATSSPSPAAGQSAVAPGDPQSHMP
jgi:hypothetical protein